MQENKLFIGVQNFLRFCADSLLASLTPTQPHDVTIFISP